MDMQMRKSEDKISTEELNVVFAKYKLTLPYAYKQFILENNGGYNTLSKYNEEIHIDHFYCIKLKIDDDIFSDGLINAIEIIELYQIEENILEEGLFPFAADSGGNTYCIAMNKNEFGEIYKFFWDGSPKRFVCNSFENLLSGLI